MPIVNISASIVANSSVGAGSSVAFTEGYGYDGYGTMPYGSVERTEIAAQVAANSSINANLTLAGNIPVSVGSVMAGSASVGADLRGGTPVIVPRTGHYGTGHIGLGPYGGALIDLRVESAASEGISAVSIVFNDILDFGFSPNLAPVNYTFSPPLTVFGVIQQSARSVILITAAQSSVTYTVTVSLAKSGTGQSLNPNFNQASFLAGVITSVSGVPLTPTRVRAVFTQPMLVNANLTDPTKYTVQGMDGASVPITSVTLEQPAALSVLLTLGTPLETHHAYQLSVSPDVHTNSDNPLTQHVSLFEWIDAPKTTTIAVDQFSGEVQNGPYGIHNGLIFFSPALLTPAANSLIQIDEIDVCTKAYDEYHFPQPIDPIPLFTHGGGVVPAVYPTALNDSVLWAPFPRLFEAQLNVGFHVNDLMPQAVDGPASVTFQQPWDPSRVALLNNTAWYLFNNTGLVVPPLFITADNLTPIPPGPTTIMILSAPMVGSSSMGGTPTATMTLQAGLGANSSMGGTPEPAVLIASGIGADSNVAGAAGVKTGSVSQIEANSFMSADLTVFP